jgi:hypothetical protein
MDEVASIKGEDKRAVEAFLSAMETLSKLNDDPEFYKLAVNALKEYPIVPRVQSKCQTVGIRQFISSRNANIITDWQYFVVPR